MAGLDRLGRLAVLAVKQSLRAGHLYLGHVGERELGEDAHGHEIRGTCLDLAGTLPQGEHRIESVAVLPGSHTVGGCSHTVIGRYSVCISPLSMYAASFAAALASSLGFSR